MNHIQTPNDAGLFSTFWKPIIRPTRLNYTVNDLGINNFVIEHTIVYREDYSITNSKNQTIQVSIYTADENVFTPHPFVIYLHSNSGSRLEAKNIIQYIAPFGMSLVTFDFVGCGLSDGFYVSLGWYEHLDLIELINDLKIRKQGLITKIGLWGRSMGAVTAIMAASKIKVDCIICDSAFYEFKTVFTEIAEKNELLPSCLYEICYYFLGKKIEDEAGFKLDDLSTIEYLGKMKETDIFFMVGEQDQLINPNNTKMLYNQYKGNKEFHKFPGDHNSKRPAQLLLEVQRFLIKHLRPPIQFEVVNGRKKYSSPKQLDTDDKKDQLSTVSMNSSQYPRMSSSMLI